MNPSTPESDPSTRELETVRSRQNDLVPEEFPEGPYGGSLTQPTLDKSSSWQKGQEAPHRYAYENLELHRDEPRDYPGEDREPFREP